MKIKLLTMVRGAAVQGDPGEVVDWPDAIATDLVAGGYAVAIGGAEAEAAEAPDAETADASPSPDEVADMPDAETAVTRPHRATRGSAREAADSE